MARVLLAGLKHEVNTFVPGVTTLEDFRRRYLLEGAAVFGPARGSGQEIDGIVQVAKAEGIELVPSVAAYGGASRPVQDAAYAYIRERTLAKVEEERGRIDGVILALHGAMATETSEDPEGELIAAIRDVVGPDLPIVVSFDMHCHLTDRKVRAADAIVGYHTHPHVDFVDTGMRAMRIMARRLCGEVRPVVVQRKIRMVTSAEHHNTSRPPMSDLFDRIAAMQREPGILGATVFATQPWMDVAELGWSTVVVADGDRALAQARADELARMAWDRRERFLVRKTPIAEAVRQALASAGRPFVFADSADAVTGGAYGDGNVLLRALLEMGFTDSALLTLTDPEAAAASHSAGVGGEVTIAVGGKLAPRFYSACHGDGPCPNAHRRQVRVRAAADAHRRRPGGGAPGGRHQSGAERAARPHHRPGDLPASRPGAAYRQDRASEIAGWLPRRLRTVRRRHLRDRHAGADGQRVDEVAVPEDPEAPVAVRSGAVRPVVITDE